eukprot:Rmarinus@m.775
MWYAIIVICASIALAHADTGRLVLTGSEYHDNDYVVPIRLLSGDLMSSGVLPLPYTPIEPGIPTVAIITQTSPEKISPWTLTQIASRMVYPNIILALVVPPELVDYAIQEFGRSEDPGFRIFATDRVYETVSICLDADIYV